VWTSGWTPIVRMNYEQVSRRKIECVVRVTDARTGQGPAAAYLEGHCRAAAAPARWRP
jgi:hypothetical protein